MFVFRVLMRMRIVVYAGTHLAALWNDPYRLVMVGIAFVSLLVAVLATAATIRWLTGDGVFSFWAAMLVPLMAQFTLAYAWDNPFTTPYDVPSVMFFALAMYLVLRRSWWAYYPIFVLAVVNRETACFITVFFAVWEWVRLGGTDLDTRTRLRWIVPHVAVQAAIWIAIKVTLARHFANNVHDGAYMGGLFMTHFRFNLSELLKPQQWPLMLSVCCFSLPFIWMQRRYISSKGLRWALAVILPLYFACLVVVGIVVEIRIFADWIALVVPAVALIVWNRFRPVERPQQKPEDCYELSC